MSAGYSPTPLPKKLGMKDGARVATLGAPDHLGSLLEPLPRGVTVQSGLRGRGGFDVLMVFASTPRELHDRFSRARAKVDTAGAIWACWPKLTSPLSKGLRESDVREHGLSTGLVDNKVCAIDADWSGLRFVVRLADR